MDYSEALTKKNKILAQMEILGKEMSEIQYVIDNFKQSIAQVNNFVGKYVCIHEHHYIFVTEVTVKNDMCIFKGPIMTTNEKSIILDRAVTEFTLPVKDLPTVKEISKIDFIKILTVAVMQFVKTIDEHTNE